MNSKNTNINSYLMLIGSMLIFGTIGIFRRYIPISSGLLACSRGFLGAIFLCFLVKCRGIKLQKNLERKTFLLIALSGAMLGINWMLLFEAYNHTTIATATLCYYMEPTIVVLLSPLFLKERLTPKKLLCAAIAVVGMIFVSGITQGAFPTGNDLQGILYGLGAAGFYSAVVILNKKISFQGAYEKTIIQLFAAAVVMIPYLLLTEDFHGIQINPTVIGLILLVGVLHTGIAYALYFGSIERFSGQTMAIFSYVDPVSALLFSFLILGETLPLAGLMGAVLIIGAAIGSEIDFPNQRNIKKAKPF